MIEQDNLPKETPIYSKWAVLGFCVFFSPVFGGFLIRQNLIEKGLRKEASLALLVSFILAAITALLSTTLLRGPGTTFAANFVEGALLVEYIYKRYFPDHENCPKKGIGKPLAISFLFVFVLLLIFILAGVPLPQQ